MQLIQNIKLCVGIQKLLRSKAKVSGGNAKEKNTPCPTVGAVQAFPFGKVAFFKLKTIVSTLSLAWMKTYTLFSLLCSV